MIRAYQPSDLDAVLALFHRSVHALGATDYTARQLAAWAPDEPDREAWRERLATGTTLVAERDGVIAGFARLGEAGYLDLFYVDPAHTGVGVGRELLEDIIDRLQAEGVVRAWCHASLTARPFFEHHGFRAIARQTVRRNGVDMDNWSMTRDITPS